eukprot:gene12018-13646_t
MLEEVDSRIDSRRRQRQRKHQKCCVSGVAHIDTTNVRMDFIPQTTTNTDEQSVILYRNRHVRLKIRELFAVSVTHVCLKPSVLVEGMASSSVIIVPKEIGRRADGLINSGVSSSVIKGVELLLQENIYIDGGSALPAINQLDCSVLFRKGTNALQNVPFDLLGVEVNCQTVDVRKAYKKLALKYHPDKNPKTTPLFQLIQAASTKLTDSDQRAKEAATVAQKRGAAGMRAEHRASAASFQSAFQKHQSANPTSFPSAKPAAAQGSYPSQSSQAQAGGRQQSQQQPQQQQQQYAYQQYQFKQQGQAQPQQPPQQQQQQSYQSQQQSKPQQAAPQATPNVYGQPQPSYNAQHQQYMNQQQRPQQPSAAQPSSSTTSSSS